MNILFLTSDYPNRFRASSEFVKTLVDEMANRGNQCYVIAPHSINREKRIWRGLERVEMKNGGSVIIARPNHLSFSNWKIGRIRLTDLARKIAIHSALCQMKFKPEVAYGHFWICGWELYNYAKKKRIPLFVATGESIISEFIHVTKSMKSFFEYVQGVICVSSKNKNESIELGLTTGEKCMVAPNSINTSLFHINDKQKIRVDLNIPENAFVVAFVGWFKHVKGPERLAAAIDTITEGEPVYSIFIGAGTEENPQCRNMLVKKYSKHDGVPIYLNAADVFVLPTRHEGCCNSIVEAMACGLPIISSNLPFNWDILDDSNSIMVDPDNIEDIAKAIVTLRDNKELRLRLAQGALATAENLTINKRAAKIEEFIKKRIG